MDFLEQGKQLTQQGKFDEALDSLLLALENDKENPDIHFYIGLCYSSLEEFSYAKYHYQVALSLDPEHGKTKFVWESIKNVEAQKPPERKLTRAAAAKQRKTQENLQREASQPSGGEPQPAAFEEEDHFVSDRMTAEVDSQSRYKVTDAKWEKAFPIDNLDVEQETMGTGMKIILILIGLGLIALAAFFVYRIFGPS